MSRKLEVERLIKAPPARVFEAWTSAEALQKWWGPAGVTCGAAEVDLRVGGRYRLRNDFGPEQFVWIEGTFTVIEPPARLEYSWQLSGGPEETVIVTFEGVGQQTLVRVVHIGMADQPAHDEHERGWFGCLDGLVELLVHRDSGFRPPLDRNSA